MTTVITGVGLAVPGEVSPQLLRGPVLADATPVDPAIRLGRKGLRYKDRATQLGLCAALDALLASGLMTPDGLLSVPGESVAVVVSSNFGNLDTVCRVARTITQEGTRGVSPMDTPNASSNILASEVAIRFGLRGPNLMVCNGETSGLDAVGWASRLLRAGRAEHVLVLGVEPDNEVVRQFTGGSRLLDGGAGLVVELAERAESRGAAVLAGVGRYVRTGALADCVDRLAVEPSTWFAPSTALVPDSLADIPGHDLSSRWGSCSGALGVLQCVAAVGWFAEGGDGPVIALSGDDSCDATAGLVLLAGAGR